MSPDHLYVDRKAQRYEVVRRHTPVVDDDIRPEETVLAAATHPSSAVLYANRLQHQYGTDRGVVVSERVAKELGWR